MADTIDRFDMVMINDQSNITYLSGPPNEKPSPKGNWSVVFVINNDIVCAQGLFVVRIPANQVKVIAKYNPQPLINVLGKMSDG